MTKQQLIDSLKSKFTSIGEEKQTGTEKIGDKTLTHFAIPVFDKVADTLARRWVNFYVDSDGLATWQDSEPKPTPSGTSFVLRVQTFVNSKITDGTIKFGSVREINEQLKKATVSAIMADKTTKTVILTETTENNFNLETI